MCYITYCWGSSWSIAPKPERQNHFLPKRQNIYQIAENKSCQILLSILYLFFTPFCVDPLGLSSLGDVFCWYSEMAPPGVVRYQIRICLIMEDVTSRHTCSLRFTQSQIWQIGLNFERKLAFVETKFPQKVRVKEITNRSRKGTRLPNLIKYHCPLQLHFIFHFCIIN